MLSVAKKIRNIFVVLFLCAWCVSAVHLGKQHFASSEAETTEINSVISGTPASKAMDNTSLLITTFVGVVNYIYQK